jgi:uroporphyrinogen decarboxylase
MNSYELVKRAIEFGGPERIPINFDENVTYSNDVKYGDDFVWLFVDNAPDFVPSVPGENEMGIVYETIDESFGQPATQPLSDISKLETFKLPDYTIAQRYTKIKKRIAENPDKYYLSMFPHFLFLTMLELIDFENLMCYFIVEPEKMRKLIGLLTESCVSYVDQCAKRGIHGIIAIEDLGLQDRLFISPQMWRDFFKEPYRRIIKRLHDNNMHFFIHACGEITELIEDFIEIGVDVVQIDQQENMGIGKLAELYAGRICFFCPVDIQTHLIKSNNSKGIEDAVKELTTSFSKNGGGFMAKMYPQPAAINIPDENIECMCNAFIKFGTFFKRSK